MEIVRITNAGNDAARVQWVKGKLKQFRASAPGPELLDVGAGESPFREAAEEVGWSYRSHDFSAYVPSQDLPGLQDSTWNYPSHDFVCDIVDIPEEARSDFVLCTEVLEHVPDPVRAYERMCNLVRPGGFIVITVPFLSLMHQAPFWFQAGLSPFWFEYWAERNHVEIEELVVLGDYADLMSQELARLLTTRPRVRGLSRVGRSLPKRLRSRLEPAVLESGGMGTFCVARKPGIT